MGEWYVRIGYEDVLGIEDYWFIENTIIGTIHGTNTVNETMSRRWLSMNQLDLSIEDVNNIILDAKKQRGWI